MTSHRPDISTIHPPLRSLLPTILLISCLGCEPSPSAKQGSDAGSAGQQTVSIQLNWYPEVEHGGVYQAVSDGTFREAGFEVDIRPGGRSTPIAPELAMGRSQFAITNADDVVLFRAQGANVVAVLAAAQNHPRCILVRADSGVTSFDELAGLTLQRQPGRAFLEFMRKKGLLEGVREVPYHNSVTGMVTDAKIAIQAYVNAEPLLAEQQGLDVIPLMVSDLGWNPYSSVLVTTDEYLANHRDDVMAITEATRQGWVNYLRDGTTANAAILEANSHGMTPEALEFGGQQFSALSKPSGEDSEIGSMTLERWQTLVKQMEELELIEAGSVRPEDCFVDLSVSLGGD